MQPFDPQTHQLLLQVLDKAMPAIVFGEDWHAILSDNVCEILAGKKHLIVADANTYAAAGQALEHALNSVAEVRILTLETLVHPRLETAQYIAAQAKDVAFIIAVGSGTISDLCKIASHEIKLPYVMVPTAPSMNGYTSINASLVIDGDKQSLAAQLPSLVLMHAQVLAAAPQRLIRSGIGDSLARTTAQADWLLSHFLTGEAYNDTPYRLMQNQEEKVFSQISAIVAHDAAAVGELMKLLLLAGFGMTIAGSSRPASGGEHMIAHWMERRFGGESFHGEQIAISSFTMLQMQHRLLPNVANEIRQAIQPILWSPEKFKNLAKEAGLALDPESIGWRKSDYAQAVREAKNTRQRYTFLNISG